MPSRKSFMLGAAAATLVFALVAGAFFAGRQTGRDPATKMRGKAFPLDTKPEAALTHAYKACVAYHRPNQISFDNRRAVTDTEINSAFFEARSEANLAVALDPRWRQLAESMSKLTANSGRIDPNVWEEHFPMVRAQCLVTGAGDINNANLVPSPLPE